MTLRRATLSDVPGMSDVLDDIHARSVYAGKATINPALARSVLAQSIQRHGGKGEGGTWCMVSESDGTVTGFIIGMLHPIYQVGEMCTATDLFWITTEKASARDRVGLMLSMVDWAKAHKKVFDIICASPATVSDPEKLGKIMAALGFEPFGSLWRIEVEK